jgi:hypothetical protein
LQQPAYSQSWTSRGAYLDPLQHRRLCASVLADATGLDRLPIALEDARNEWKIRYSKRSLDFVALFSVK